MKITKRQLQKIIKEEIEAITEGQDAGQDGRYVWKDLGDLHGDIAELANYLREDSEGSGAALLAGILAALNSGRYELVRGDLQAEVIDPEMGLIDSGKTKIRAEKLVDDAAENGARSIQQLIWQLNDQWRPGAKNFGGDEVMGPDLYWQFIFNKLDGENSDLLKKTLGSRYIVMKDYVGV